MTESRIRKCDDDMREAWEYTVLNNITECFGVMSYHTSWDKSTRRIMAMDVCSWLGKNPHTIWAIEMHDRYGGDDE